LNKFTIEYYQKKSGQCPFIEFRDSLDKKMSAKVMRMLLVLEENGNELREPYSKHLQEGIFELRIKQGTDISRVLYFFRVGCKIIITHGFVKKTNHTPQSEIAMAIKYREDYFNRSEEHDN